MSPNELYDEVLLEFPSVWPQDPSLPWESLYAGESASIERISNLLARYIDSSEVFILVHSSPGIGVIMHRDAAPIFISDFFLKADIQVSDKQYQCFVEISRVGVGAGWCKQSKNA